MANRNTQRPLTSIATACQNLANTINGLAPGVQLDVASFSRVCLLISPLLGSLGTGFMFVKVEFDQKVRDIVVCTGTLQQMIGADIQAGRARTIGSHTKNLLIVKRGLDMLRVILENIRRVEGNTSLEGPARAAYQQVFAPYHPSNIRDFVLQGLAGLLTKDELTNILNEDERSMRTQMERYIVSATPVIRYVESLFVANGLDLDG